MSVLNGAPSPRPRIALLNLTCEDNSYRSAVAAANLTALIHAESSADPSYDWVEREALEKAEQELQVDAFGLMDRTEEIMVGKWVKADWAILGRFSTNGASGRSVWFEVVDLGSADLLATNTITLLGLTNNILSAGSHDVQVLVTGLKKLLKLAAEEYTVNTQKPALAFFFLAPMGYQNPLPNLDEDFREALLAASTNPEQPYHMLHFHRAAESMDEAALVLSGLVENDADSWEKVAQYYVWGSHKFKKHRWYDVKLKKWITEQRLEVSLQIWNNKAGERSLALNLTNPSSAKTAARQLVAAVLPLLEASGGSGTSDTVRHRIADSLVAEARNLAAGGAYASLDTVEKQRGWLTLVQILETACFFDPSNRSARESWLRVRWGYPASNVAPNRFRFDRRRSQAWGRHVDQFGLNSETNVIFCTAFDASDVTAEYVSSAWRLFELCGRSQNAQAEVGVPRDAGGHELGNWRREFGAEFCRRLLKSQHDPSLANRYWDFFYAVLGTDREGFVISDPVQRKKVLEYLWPGILERFGRTERSFDSAYRRNLELHYQEVGQPGGEKALLAQLDQPRGLVAPTNHIVQLPRIAVLDPAETGDLLEVPPLALPVPLRGGEPRKLLLNPPDGFKGLHSMAFCEGRLWLVLEADEPVNLDAPVTAAQRDLQKLRASFLRLWVIDPVAGTLDRVGGPLATNVLNSLLPIGHELWLGLADAGIAVWNLHDDTITRFGLAEGLTATSSYALARSTLGVFALNGTSGFSFLPAGDSMWKSIELDLPHRFGVPYAGALRQLAGADRHLLLYSNGVLLGDMYSNAWVVLERSLHNTPQDPGIGRPAEITSDARGNFWIASDSGLHCVEVRTGRVVSQYVCRNPTTHTQRLRSWPNPARSAIERSARLQPEIQRTLEAREKLATARKANPEMPNLFLPASRLPAAPYSLAPDGEFLWVAVAGAASNPPSLLLHHPASRSWVGGFALPRGWFKLAVGGERLWAITPAQNGIELLSFDKRHLLTTPQDEWVPDRLSEGEISELLNRLTPHQQAILRVLGAEPGAAVDLLLPEVTREPSSETLFLLALAYDAHGLKLDQVAERYLDQLLAEYPDSVYSACLVSKRKREQVRFTTQEHTQLSTHTSQPGPSTVLPGSDAGGPRTSNVVRDYDSNQDEKLNVTELAIALESEPSRINLQMVRSQIQSPLEVAQRLLRSLDSNRDGLLDSSELSNAPKIPLPQPLPPWSGTPAPKAKTKTPGSKP